MKKRTVRVKILVIWGLIASVWNIFAGFSSPNITLFTDGLICIFLSVGIFMLWNWARILAIILSSIFIGIYIMLIIAAINRAYQGFAGIACFFNAPLFLLSIFCIDVLLHKENKILFKRNKT